MVRATAVSLAASSAPKRLGEGTHHRPATTGDGTIVDSEDRLSFSDLCPSLGEHVASMAALDELRVADEADKLVLRRALGLDIIPVVVCVVAWECLAARRWGLRILWVDYLDVVDIVWLYDGRDVEVVQSAPSVEADLSEHAVAIGLVTVADGVPVANPSLWELCSDGLSTLEAELWELRRAFLWDELDGAANVVLADHVDGVGSSDTGGGECENSLEELHCGGCWVCESLVVGTDQSSLKKSINW